MRSAHPPRSTEPGFVPPSSTHTSETPLCPFASPTRHRHAALPRLPLAARHGVLAIVKKGHWRCPVSNPGTTRWAIAMHEGRYRRSTNAVPPARYLYTTPIGAEADHLYAGGKSLLTIIMARQITNRDVSKQEVPFRYYRTASPTQR